MSATRCRRFAFELISASEEHRDPGVRAELVHVLAIASGAIGMVGGQVLDLEAGKLASRSSEPTIADVMRLQAMKTGQLITAACEMGAIVGGRAKPSVRRSKPMASISARHFRSAMICSMRRDRVRIPAKATGKDAAAGKATLVGMLGIERGAEHLDRSIGRPSRHLGCFGEKAESLAEAARLMGRRDS